MYISNRKMLYSLSFVKTLASIEGFNTSTPEIDDDSVDLQLQARDFKGKLIRNPAIQLQLKCTVQQPSKDGALHFALPIKNYNDLRGHDLLCPRYLFVVTLPSDEPSSWISLDDHHLTLRRCGYWFSLRDAPPLSNTHSVTIEIPSANLLTSTALRVLMERASEGKAV